MPLQLNKEKKNWNAEGDTDLNIYSWNIEDCGLHVIGFGLQGRGTFLAC